MFARAPALLAVCSSGAGYDTIGVDAATRAVVLACNQAGANREAVAEHVVGYMLALSKRIAQSHGLMMRTTNLVCSLLPNDSLLEPMSTGEGCCGRAGGHDGFTPLRCRNASPTSGSRGWLGDSADCYCVVCQAGSSRSLQRPKPV